MISVSTSPQPVSAPHVKVERVKVASTTRNSRATNGDEPTTSTPKPLPVTNKRFANVKAKVGSLDAINYTPKPSEKQIQSFKQDFSHVQSKVDTKLVLSTPDVAADAIAAKESKTDASTTTASRKPFVVGTSTVSRRFSSTAVSSPTAATTATPHPRHHTISSGSPASSSRRMSKNIIPTQVANYDHVQAKVGSLDKVGYKNRDRTGSQSSSPDESGALSPTNSRSLSPSALSSTSSTSNGISPTRSAVSTGRRSSFKIPPSKKADYSKIKSKVGSLENITHTPQGGNLRIFSEKLTFREQAQSKISREIAIVEFYTDDQSFDTTAQEEGEEAGPEEQEDADLQGQDSQEGDHEGSDDQSAAYGSEAALEELNESDELSLDEQDEQADEADAATAL